MTREEQYDPEKKMPRREDSLGVIAELMREKGFSRIVRFDGSWEGNTLPGGTPNESGTVLTQDGRVFHYWLDWDPNKTAPDGTKGWYTLGENFKDPQTGEPYPLFREVLPESESYPKPDDEAFLRAMRELGLA